MNVTTMQEIHITEFAMYPSFPTLGDLLRHIPEAAHQIAATYRQPPRAVKALRRDPLEAKIIWVPLNMHRDHIRSQHWYPLGLAAWIARSNEDSLHLMGQCLVMQIHTCHVMPLMMDENIFYRLANLVYSRIYSLLRTDIVVSNCSDVHGFKHTS